MTAGEYPAFVESCRQLRLGLDDLLGVEYPQHPDNYQPTAWLGAIAVAGNMLRKDFERRLVRRAVPEGIIGDSIEEMTLRAIINASLDKVEPDDQETAFVSQKAKRYDCCKSADEAFSLTIEALQKPNKLVRDSYGEISGWCIVTGERQRPLAIIKTKGEMSAMSLLPFAVNGIPYPPGSLMRIDTEWDEFIGEGKYAVPVSQVTQVGFLRLSAFALEPARRWAVFEKVAEGGSELSQCTILEIRRLAERAVSHSIPLA